MTSGVTIQLDTFHLPLLFCFVQYGTGLTASCPMYAKLFVDRRLQNLDVKRCARKTKEDDRRTEITPSVVS